MRRRATAVVAAVVMSGVGLGLTAGPAEAARHDPCATARAAFRAAMTEARFWIGAADTLAAAGSDAMANLATAEANYYLDLASGALGEMESAC